MTIHEFPRLVPPTTARRPARSGEPWTDDDYTSLVRLAREGASTDAVAETLARSPSAVQARAMKLLPLDQRGVPGERVVQHLGDLARADEDYPWATHLVATPPPRPVVNHVHPPAQYDGVDGLDDNDLVAIAAAFAQLRGGVAGPEIASAIAIRVLDRGLQHQLRQALEERGPDLADGFLLEPDQYSTARWGASTWGERRWGQRRDGYLGWAEEPPTDDSWPVEPDWDNEPPPPQPDDEPPFA